MTPALLRVPPFPDHVADISREAAPSAPPPARAAVFAAMKEARVGGAFWGERFAGPFPDSGVIIRSAGNGKDAKLRHEFDDAQALWIAPDTGMDELDPWSVVPGARLLIAHGDDEWLALASVLDIPVRVLSEGDFGSPGDTPEELKERAFEAMLVPLPDPFSEGWLGPLEAIALLADWRRVIEGNRGGNGQRIVAACGITWWKRDEIRRFLWSPGAPARIYRSTSRALAAAKAEGGALAVWPSRMSPNLKQEAQDIGIELVRIEDGFIRSVGLGSNLVPPLSIIVDRQGIHFDPSAPSDLETILAETTFTPEILSRAAALRETIIAAGISKYSASSNQPAFAASARGDKRVVLVPGQVENDMSVLAGGGGLTSNLELLSRARKLEPDAEIWWRPHPDVDAGHRVGAVDDTAALQHADRIVREGSMAELLDTVDGVHVLTSLSGFEALLRGCDVTCHGVPFYSGWGLTRDLGDVPERRGRKLSLDQLVAGVLVLYPRYLDPVTGLPCPPEVLVRRIARGEASNRLGWVEPLRRAQGQLMTRLRRKDGR